MIFTRLCNHRNIKMMKSSSVNNHPTKKIGSVASIPVVLPYLHYLVEHSSVEEVWANKSLNFSVKNMLVSASHSTSDLENSNRLKLDRKFALTDFYFKISCLGICTRSLDWNLTHNRTERKPVRYIVRFVIRE